MEVTTVYNLTVDDFHTFAIGDFEILVHNNPCAAGGANNGRRAFRGGHVEFMDPKDAFDSLADAIGAVDGYAKIIGNPVNATSHKYLANGYTKVYYVRDSNGIQYTVAYNPEINKYWVDHGSSGWYGN